MRRLGWLLAGAALVRLILIAVWEPVLAADAADYDRMARLIANGEGFLNTRGEPTSFRPPLYPLLLAFLHLFSSHGSRWVTVVQVLFDLVTVVVIYHLARRWMEDGWALLAAALVAFNVALVSSTGRVLSESLFTMLFAIGLWSTVVWMRSPPASEHRSGAITGFVFGLACLTRGVLLPFVPLLLLVVSLDRGRIPKSAFTLALVFVLTLAPWTLRNAIVHRAFVPVTTQVGITLYAGVEPPGGIFGLQPTDSIVQRTASLPEPEQSRILTRESIRRAMADPGRMAVLEARKVVYFWSPVDWEILPRYGTFNSTYAWTAIVALAFMVIGGVGGTPTRRELWPLWAPILFLFLMALVFHGSPRYRLPSEPFMAILAAVGARTMVDRWGRQRALLVLGVLGGLCLLAALGSDPLRAWVGQWIG